MGIVKFLHLIGLHFLTIDLGMIMDACTDQLLARRIQNFKLFRDCVHCHPYIDQT